MNAKKTKQYTKGYQMSLSNWYKVSEVAVSPEGFKDKYGYMTRKEFTDWLNK